MKTKQAIAEISDLPIDERAKAVEQILETFNKPDPKIEKAWMDEVDRRAKEVERGNVEMLSQEEFEQRRRKQSRL